MGQGVHQACWVDNHLSNASFDLEETKCVILVIIQKGSTIGDETVVSPYIKQRMTEYGLALSVDACYLDKNVDFVELILVSGSRSVMEPMAFELIAEDSKPGIRLVGDDA